MRSTSPVQTYVWCGVEISFKFRYAAADAQVMSAAQRVLARSSLPALVCAHSLLFAHVVARCGGRWTGKWVGAMHRQMGVRVHSMLDDPNSPWDGQWMVFIS